MAEKTKARGKGKRPTITLQQEGLDKPRRTSLYLAPSTEALLNALAAVAPLGRAPTYVALIAYAVQVACEYHRVDVERVVAEEMTKRANEVTLMTVLGGRD